MFGQGTKEGYASSGDLVRARRFCTLTESNSRPRRASPQFAGQPPPSSSPNVDPALTTPYLMSMPCADKRRPRLAQGARLPGVGRPLWKIEDPGHFLRALIAIFKSIEALKIYGTVSSTAT
ncbi:hypothetical protein PsYK624_059300 [Phanerochaete sordida]|uniref:Uncharacterized protein n=1 Tax=Phanerochaete sordida TaxID=48140 RepID=A0A9P3G850_9APHY|nr:hypothetical protein PsYK624_059300 [Phanerochaete sordida]